jgi:transketolase
VNSEDLDKLAIATIRGLSLDMPRRADSGHSGTALSLAPLGWLLYSRVLRHAPNSPDWPNRDRVVLSNGHACVLLYALLHLFGYELSLQDLKDFRTPFSKTPGHPETWVTPGIDVSTGPLGLGLAHGVGYAIAERFKRAHFGEAMFCHHTYVLCSDGDLMEGVTSEASSLAGHLKLSRLVVFYDDNQVTIDGPASDSFSEDVEARYRAYGWQTLSAAGEDLEELESRINEAQSDSRPTLIKIRTTIGFPSPGMSGKPEAHSPPFSPEEIRATKLVLGLDSDQDFQIPEPLRALPRAFQDQGRRLVSEWEAATTPEWEAWVNRRWPGNCPVPSFSKPIATRSASGIVLNTLAEHLPNLIGGSADLAGSTKAQLTSFADFSSQNPTGRNLRFGVREQAMASITNGLAQHGGLIPFCSTYFSFSDFMKPSIRMAALAGLPAIFVFSHDSLALGGDGPTHQPVEQLAALRALPNCLVLRPADANETTQAWQLVMQHQTGPVVLVLSRQDLPVLPVGELKRGGYVVEGNEGITLIGAGSEVHLCMEARNLLKKVGVESRIVSVPCWSLFWSQPVEYRDQVLGPGPRVAVEAGASLGWHRFVGDSGIVLGLDRFGASGPGDDLMKRYGFTPEAVVQAALQVASSHR